MSDEDKHLARRLYNFLSSRLAAGKVTPLHPMSSTVIIAEAGAQGISLDTRKIQSLVQYLRTDPEWQVLIGSTSGKEKGYSLCKTPEEFVKMNKHLKSRAINDWLSYSLPLKKHRDSQTLELEWKDDPVVSALVREFGVVEVKA